MIELHPEKPIFPNATLVAKLLEGTDLNYWQITLMSDAKLKHCAAIILPTHIFSDGIVTSQSVPSTQTTLAGRQFEVNCATWAIHFRKGEVNRVYLWAEAWKSAEQIVEAVRQILHGEMIPATRA